MHSNDVLSQQRAMVEILSWMDMTWQFAIIECIIKPFFLAVWLVMTSPHNFLNPENAVVKATLTVCLFDVE